MKTLKRVLAATALVTLLTSAAHAQSATCTLATGGSVPCTFTLQVIVSPVGLVGLGLSNDVLTTATATNANTLVGVVTAITNPASGTVAGLTIALTPTGNFVLSSPTLPSNIMTGAANVPAGSYPITITPTIAASGG